VVFSNSTNPHVAPPRANNWEEVIPIVVEELESWKAARQNQKRLEGCRVAPELGRPSVPEAAGNPLIIHKQRALRGY
jgi:hypothetical protein